jgi:hypothetical protein
MRDLKSFWGSRPPLAGVMEGTSRAAEAFFRRENFDPSNRENLMLKRSLMMTAAAILFLGPALAEDPAAPAGSTQAPAATPSTTTASTETAKPGFIAEQGKDQWLASKNLIGAKIGVGGFLGIGAKNVAVPFKSLELSRDTDGNDKIAMRFTKDELQQAPDFKPLLPPPPKPPVAGGPGTTSRPGGAMPGPKTQ